VGGPIGCPREKRDPRIISRILNVVFTRGWGGGGIGFCELTNAKLNIQDADGQIGRGIANQPTK